jgi:hypothetical protein
MYLQTLLTFLDADLSLASPVISHAPLDPSMQVLLLITSDAGKFGGASQSVQYDRVSFRVRI